MRAAHVRVRVNVRACAWRPSEGRSLLREEVEELIEAQVELGLDLRVEKLLFVRTECGLARVGVDVHRREEQRHQRLVAHLQHVLRQNPRERHRDRELDHIAQLQIAQRGWQPHQVGEEARVCVEDAHLAHGLLWQVRVGEDALRRHVRRAVVVERAHGAAHQPELRGARRDRAERVVVVGSGVLGLLGLGSLVVRRAQLPVGAQVAQAEQLRLEAALVVPACKTRRHARRRFEELERSGEAQAKRGRLREGEATRRHRKAGKVE
eukprot:6184866-Pleurochrysis_carterae.AAC.5